MTEEREESKKKQKIRKLEKDCYRRKEMLYNNRSPSSISILMASLLPFICILNTISQTFIVLRVKRHRRKQAKQGSEIRFSHSPPTSFLLQFFCGLALFVSD